jgi:glycosyltransferase involved in cell wall biosynthesis
MPTVSVILPTFNRTKYLRAAVESVCAQTFSDWELIIADDGSADATKEYLTSIDDPRVRTIWLTHSGNPAQVRNAGIQSAKGGYVAFLDSDDLWLPTKLERQVAALRERSGALWSYTDSYRIDEDGHPLAAEGGPQRPLKQGWIVESLLTLETVMAMPTVMADRELVNEIGGFDEAQRFGEYHDLCLRLALKSPVVALSEPLCAVRSHDDHYSFDRIADYAGWVRLYGKMAALAPNSALRSHCLKMRAKTSVILAGLHGDRGDYRAVWMALGNAATFSWRYPTWWAGALKSLARPLLPEALLSAYRRIR